MGMCKVCGKVYSVFDMVDGICLVCRNPKLKDELLKEEQKKSKDLKNLVNLKKTFDKYEMGTILGESSFLGSSKLI